MLPEPPALHDEGVAALLAHEDDGHALLRPIHVEEHSAPAEKPQFALGHRIWPERLHVPRLDQRIRFATCQDYIGPEFWSSYPSQRR